MRSETEGRGRALPRRTSLAVGILVLGVIAAITAPRWLGASQTDPGAQQDHAPRRSMAGDPPDAPGRDSAVFDPMRRVISVGAVPGLHPTDSVTARYRQTASLEDDDRYLMVEVRAYPRGHAGMFFAPQGEVDPSAGAPADPVGDVPAYWLPDGQRLFQYEAARLAWRWGDGGWVFVTAASTDDQGRHPKVSIEQLRDLAHRVAVAVRVDAVGTAVTMPFTMPAPPEGYRLTGTGVLRGTRLDGTPILRATLGFSSGADPQNPDVSPPNAGRSLTVTATLSTPDDKPGSVNRTVDGRPVAEHGTGVTVYEAGEGLAVEVEGAGIEVALAVAIVPGARDESAWTGRPLRAPR